MTSQLDLLELYTRTKMKRKIYVKSSELTTNFDKNFINILRNEVEGKCNREGYVEKGSIEIIDHGTLDTEVIRYKGGVMVNVTFTGKVVNPNEDDIIECQIQRYNDFGIMAKAGPLNIIIPFNENKDNTIVIGNKIKVKVVKSTLILNDDHIDVYATFYDEKLELKSNPKNEDIENIQKKGDILDNIDSDDLEDIEENDEDIEYGENSDISNNDSEPDEDELEDSDDEGDDSEDGLEESENEDESENEGNKEK